MIYEESVKNLSTADTKEAKTAVRKRRLHTIPLRLLRGTTDCGTAIFLTAPYELYGKKLIIFYSAEMIKEPKP